MANETIKLAAWTVTSLGALNWGSVEAFDVNLLTDTAGLGPETVGIVYLLIGAAGLLGLYDVGMEITDGEI
jgi:uncharacterized membrane protein YuzA (DUF378 family)